MVGTAHDCLMLDQNLLKGKAETPLDLSCTSLPTLSTKPSNVQVMDVFHLKFPLS